MAIDGCTRNATVKAGDSCDSICEPNAPLRGTTVDPLLSLTRHAARQYGVSTFQLALVNEATIDENCDNLSPNQNVCLGFTGEDCTKVYTVVANEYVYSLGLLGDFSLEDPDCYGCRGGTGHSSER